MARLLRLLPDPLHAHEPGSVDPPKITLVSLAAVAERAQPFQRTAPSWRAKVQCSSRRRFTDGVLAHVRTPGGPTSPAQPLLRLTRSPPTPCRCPSLTRSNRRGTDPYARWWGRGGTARCPPIPIVGATRSARKLWRASGFHSEQTYKFVQGGRRIYELIPILVTTVVGMLCSRDRTRPRI